MQAKHPRRVLIVDDHPDAAEMACLLLGSQGHDCRSATSGAEGLAIAESFQPDIAILDIGLPDISGYELARMLRIARGSSIYLAAMTGWGQREDRERARAAGFDEHILKPADSHKLNDVIAAADLTQ